MYVLLILLLLVLGGALGYLAARYVYFQDLDLPRSRDEWLRLISGRGAGGSESPDRQGPSSADRDDPGRRAAAQTLRDGGAATDTGSGGASPSVARAAERAPAVSASAEPSSPDAAAAAEGGGGPGPGGDSRSVTAGTPGVAPPRLERPEGEPDDLKRISGIGPGIERTLNDLGIHHFRQIAAFTPENIAWVDSHLRFKGRIEREDWVGQARALSGEPSRSPSGAADGTRSFH